MIVREDTNFILNAIGSSLSKLQGKSILITGATGFIGTYLLESLALYNDLHETSPCRIVGIARNPQRLIHTAPHLTGRQDIVILGADVCSFNFPGHFDYVIHAASPVDPEVLSRDRLGTADIIINGTRNVLQESVKYNIGRILYISSGAVYGRQPYDLPRLPEDYLGGPDITDYKFAYAEAKRCAETLCAVFNQVYGISVVLARPFTFVGPYQSLDSGFAVAQFMRSCLRKEPILIKGDGTPLRSYCYAADLAVALWMILLNGQTGRAYNVGSEEAISIYELARKVIEVVGYASNIIVAYKPTNGQKPARYIPDTARLRSELGIFPQFKLDNALKRTVAWIDEFGLCGIEENINLKKT